MLHPDYLRNLLTVSQWDDWVDFWIAHPFGERARDLRMARQVHAGLTPDSQRKTRSLEDLVPWGRHAPQARGLTDDAIDRLFGAGPGK